MAQIPRKYIDSYTKALNKLSADAQAKLAADLAKIDFAGDVATIRDAIIGRMELYCGPYTDMAAILAAEFYDGLREQSVGAKLGAYAESGREPIATEKAVRGIMQDVVEGKAAEVVVGKLTGRVDYEVKRAAGECIYRNGKRDPLKPKYARVPSGAETCRFCLMLASRGFVYHSKESAGSTGHYHSGCDCRIVVGFGDNPSVEGYDPDRLYNQWKGMEKYNIPSAKITDYALNPNHPKGKEKAEGFRKALGITSKDADYLIAAIYEKAGESKPVFRYEDEWGKRYFHDVVIEGPNGKAAKVKLGWIKGKNDGKMRLTTIHVDD